MTNLVEIDVRATDNATKTIDDVRAELSSLSGDSATPAISVRGQAEAESGIKQVSDSVSALGRLTAAPDVKLDGTDEAIASAEGLIAELRTLGDLTATPDVELKGAAETVTEAGLVSDAVKKVGSSGSSAGGGLEDLGGTLGKLSNLAMPAVIGAGVALSPVIATVGVGLGGLGIAAASTISPIIAASQATGGLKANMGTLTPVQQGMAQGLISLQGEVGKFTTSLQPQVVSIWGSALSLAGGVLKDIQPVAAATGTALNGVVQDIGADLKTGEWQNFFNFMAQNAGPDIQMVGKLFTDLLNDLPPLLEALQPVAEEFLTLADGAAKAVGALENLPAKINQVSDSNNSLLSKASDFLNFIGSKIPDGNRSILSLAQSWLSSGDAAAKSGQQMQTATVAVITPVEQLATAMSTASTDTKNLDSAWNTLVGNFNSEQQAIVAAKQAVDNYGDAVKQSGAGSLAAQGQFFAAVQSLQQMTDAEVKNHAPAAQLYADLQQEITALKSKGPLNKAEQTDLANLEKAAQAAATSTAGLTSAQNADAKSIESTLLPQITALHTGGTQLNTDMKNLATSILNTGTQSTASASARATMISDLEKAGVQASTAKTDVDNFTTALGKIPKTVSSAISVSASSSGALTAAAKISGTSVQNIEDSLQFGADGMMVQGGQHGKDSVLAALMPGELVVPAHMVNAGSVDHLRGRIPGFAAGGGIDLNAPSHFVQNDENAWATDVVKDWMSKEIGAFNAAEKAALAAVAAASTTSSLIHPTGSGASVQALMQSMAASVGWTGAEWTALNAVEEREAGYNITAQNPSSGAYGLAQFINGPSEYAQYGGSSGTAQGQITGMLNYIKQRYGDPIAAEAHEVQYGWYDQGGWLNPGYTLAYNGTGRPEAVGGAGGPVQITLSIDSSFQQLGLTPQQLEAIRYTIRTQGGGSAQKALGYGNGG